MWNAAHDNSWQLKPSIGSKESQQARNASFEDAASSQDAFRCRGQVELSGLKLITSTQYLRSGPMMMSGDGTTGFNMTRNEHPKSHTLCSLISLGKIEAHPSCDWRIDRLWDSR